MSKKGDPGRGSRSRGADKLEMRKKDSKTGLISGRGPVGLVIAKIIDVALMVVKKIFEWIWFSVTLPTFNFVWNLMFSEFHGVFAGKDKDGDCYNSSVLRYVITILLPPMGVFMSKGLSGWPSIGICSVLTLFHMFPGIIYAFIVTYDNRYADRYQQKELERIEKAKKERGVNADSAKYSFVGLVISVSLLLGFIYTLMNIAKIMASITTKN